MKNSFLSRLVGNQSGNALILSALSLPMLIGAGGLATDTIQWTLWKRQLQREADSAALAGAYAKAQSDPVAPAANGEINRMNLITLQGSAAITEPTTGTYANQSVHVALQASRTLPFSSMFLSSAPVISAEATAAIVQSGEYCVISLENTSTVGITLQGNATVDLGCGMATNSRASNAVTAGGSSSILATPVAAVGGLQWSNNYASGTKLQPYNMAQADPYASLPTPVVPSPCSNKLTVQPNDPVTTITPTNGVACYRGMDLKGTVVLNPGVYYIDGSSFSVGSQANVTGTDVTIILTSNTAANNANSIATMDINGGATINLAAPTSGTYDGVLFYQDRRAADSNQSNKINGNASSRYEGSFYLPRQAVEFTGTSGMTTNCLKIVSRRVTFSGNSSVSNTCTNEESGGAAATVVRLVG